MGYITDEVDEPPPAKILELGKSGAGKTGALASLVCAGYKIRLLNTDKNANILQSLLSDYNYPYRKFCEEHNIDWRTAVHVINVGIPMKLSTVHTRKRVGDRTIDSTERQLAPVNGDSWYKCIDALQEWKEGDVNFGHVETWGPDVVLAIDAFSKMAYMAYYNVQALNGRLGARDEGREYQRDVGGAQRILDRLLKWLASETIRCNVILTSHIAWVDETKGYARSAGQIAMEDPNAIADISGLPMAIGQALSPMIGSYFNDVFVCRQTGSGQTTRREISTVSIDGVMCKNSAFMNTSYSIGSGLAEIFATLRHQPEPTELIAALGTPKRQTATVPARKTSPVDDEIALLNAGKTAA